jgi:hypothetical protein
VLWLDSAQKGTTPIHSDRKALWWRKQRDQATTKEEINERPITCNEETVIWAKSCCPLHWWWIWGEDEEWLAPQVSIFNVEQCWRYFLSWSLNLCWPRKQGLFHNWLPKLDRFWWRLHCRKTISNFDHDADRGHYWIAISGAGVAGDCGILRPGPLQRTITDRFHSLHELCWLDLIVRVFGQLWSQKVLQKHSN